MCFFGCQCLEVFIGLVVSVLKQPKSILKSILQYFNFLLRSCEWYLFFSVSLEESNTSDRPRFESWKVVGSVTSVSIRGHISLGTDSGFLLLEITCRNFHKKKVNQCFQDQSILPLEVCRSNQMFFGMKALHGYLRDIPSQDISY